MAEWIVDFYSKDPKAWFEDGEIKQQVVRCEYCKYGYCINPSCDEKEKIYECMKYPIANLRITHEPDWFCADGKRKEGR